MKKVILLYVLTSTYIFSNINAVVSILPQHTFVKAIGGDKVNVSLMVQPGNSPHTYEPKPTQMMDIAKADIYFAIGVEFEHVWLKKFKNLNAKMQIVPLYEGITRIHMAQSHKAHHEHEGEDPHIWTAPQNVKIIVQNIYNALTKQDPANIAYYQKNLNTYLDKITALDTQIKQMLSGMKGSRKFMVFHPSWGYFAKAYDLEQIVVEVEGKEPKPKELIHVLKEAKEEKVSAIFTQPEFSDTTANIIAKELSIPVVKVSPLAPNWSDNLLNMAKNIAEKN